jgi:hypothetical protein
MSLFACLCIRFHDPSQLANFTKVGMNVVHLEVTHYSSTGLTKVKRPTVTEEVSEDNCAQVIVMMM